MNSIKYTTGLMVAAAMLIFAATGYAQDADISTGQELEFNLFQNYYTPQGTSLTTAAMYPAPHPVPYWVGGSMYTYQPFYPHQMMYWHRKNYYNYYGTSDQFYSDCQRCGQGGDALNKTSVIWKGTGYHMGNFPGSSFCVQKLGYGIKAHRYGLRQHSLGPGNCGHGHCGRGHCRRGHCGHGHCGHGHCGHGNCGHGQCHDCTSGQWSPAANNVTGPVAAGYVTPVGFAVPQGEFRRSGCTSGNCNN